MNVRRLGAFGASLLLGTLPAWAGESPDALVLHTGEVVRCQIEGTRDGFVVARVGARTYRFERHTLKAARQGDAPLPDTATVQFIESMLPHLMGSDARLQRAARAALQALGDEPALDAAAARARPAVREALRALRAESK